MVSLFLRVAAFLSVALAYPVIASPPKDSSNAYRLQAAFDPETGELQVQGTLEVVTDRRTERLRLLLNDALTVQSFEADGLRAILEPSVQIGGEIVPGLQGIIIPHPRPLEAGERVHMRFAYKGRLTTKDIKVGRGVVGPGWTELTFESFWYPIFFEEQLIRSELILTVPERYQVAGPGLTEQLAPGRWRLDPQAVVLGRITFALSDSWLVEKRTLRPGLDAALHTIKPEPRAPEILSSVSEAYQYLEGLFGSPRTAKKRITLLYPNADIGIVSPNQAFATAGDFIVMSAQGEADGQLETLKHEVAHLWWSRGRPGTADEFLSESISEYLANRLGRVKFGDDWLIRRRAGMAKRSAAITGSFNDPTSLEGSARQPLLYDRGPTALWRLHDRLGERALDRLLKEAYRRDLDSYENFLELVAEQHGKATMSWFRAQL